MEIKAQLEKLRRPLKSLISRVSQGRYITPSRSQADSILDVRGEVRAEWESVETRLTDDESRQLAADYRAGVRVTELTEKYGVHRMTVWRHLTHHGLARPQRFLTAEEAKRACALYQAGMTLSEVAKEVGSNRTSVAEALEDHGVPRRPRGVRIAFDPAVLEKLGA